MSQFSCFMALDFSHKKKSTISIISLPNFLSHNITKGKIIQLTIKNRHDQWCLEKYSLADNFIGK